MHLIFHPSSARYPPPSPPPPPALVLLPCWSAWSARCLTLFGLGCLLSLRTHIGGVVRTPTSTKVAPFYCSIFLTSFSGWRLYIRLISCATFICRRIKSATFDRDPWRLDCKESLRQLRACGLAAPLMGSLWLLMHIAFFGMSSISLLSHSSYHTSSSLHPNRPPVSIRDPLTSSHSLFVPHHGREHIRSPTMQSSPNSPPSYAWQVGRWSERRISNVIQYAPLCQLLDG